MFSANIKNRAYIELGNCLRIDNGREFLQRKDVLDAIESSGHLKIEQVDIVSQIFNNKHWFITLKKDVRASDFFGKKLEIKSKEYELRDANDRSPKEQFFKLLWWPHYFELSKIRTFFVKNNYNVIEIQDEYDQAHQTVKSGNLLIKAKLVEGFQDKKETWLRTGRYEQDGIKFYLLRKGDRPVCMYCEQIGHMRKDCPKRKLHCSKCNKTGHSENECTFAKKLEKDFFEIDDPEIGDGDDILEIETDNSGAKENNLKDAKEITMEKKVNSSKSSLKRQHLESPENKENEETKRQKQVGKPEVNDQTQKPFNKESIEKMIKSGQFIKAFEKLPLKRQDSLIEFMVEKQIKLNKEIVNNLDIIDIKKKKLLKIN